MQAPMAPGQPPPGQPQAGTSPVTPSPAPHSRLMIGQLSQSLMARKNEGLAGAGDVQDTLQSQSFGRQGAAASVAAPSEPISM
jgi:hypothetical protein